ncbi:MAG: NlpC/P60 family protein [Candidatus Marinimicrobia bacterium]|nr:NlpC/P60 family protein [Candidatus Neomarinimicrobiota bacterium]
MKKTLLTILAVLVFAACADIPVQPVQQFIDEVREDVCPDRRVNIFDVEFEQQGKTVTLKGQMNSKSGLDSLTARLEREGYTVTNKIQLLPDAALDGKYYGVINRSVANIRVEPSARSEMATQAVLGVPLRIYKKQGNNYYVQTPDGYLGWIEGGAFTAMTVKEFNTWRNSEKVIYLEDTGYIYKKASKDSDRMGDITATGILRAIEPKNGFVKIAYPDGRIGYIERSACDHFEVWSFSVQPKPQSIISLAKSYMGRPYLWGGTSTKMMDCSGFVRIVMMLHGIYLPRMLHSRHLSGRPLRKEKKRSRN